MNYKRTLTSLALAAGLLVPSVGQACQWVRNGELNKQLECRSNYRNFFKDNSALMSKLLMEAAFYAQGSADKLMIENWALRNAVDVGEGAKLLEKRRDADQLINEMNAQIRQLEALDGEGDGVQMPSAIMVGVTVPLNGDVSKMPFFKKFADFIPNPGGSAFMGWIIVPQKVELVLTEDLKVQGPKEYVTTKAPEGSYSNLLSSIIEEAPEESHLNDYGRFRLDIRFVVTPSIDAKTGRDGKFKSTYVKPTIGFAFGRNIVKSHQLLNWGASASFPGSYIKSLKKISKVGAMIPNWLIDPISRRVDTFKLGYSWSGQNKYEEYSDDDIVQFTENFFVWLRFGDRLKKTGLIGPEAEIVQKALDGKFRWGFFSNYAAFSDGEAKAVRNGLSRELIGDLVSGLSGVAGELLSRSERLAGPVRNTKTEEDIKLLERSIAVQENLEEGHPDKMSEDDLNALKAALAALKAQVEGESEQEKEK